MTFRTLIRRSLCFHWRSHLGVTLGAAIGSAALIGALVVGDSVKGSLRHQALIRLAGIPVAMDAQDRLFGTKLFSRILAAGTNEATRAFNSPQNPRDVVWGWPPEHAGGVVLHLPASVTRQDGGARANAVHCYGLETGAFNLLLPGVREPEGGVCLNQALARQLNAKVGDNLVFRMQKPSLLSHEISIAQRTDAMVVLPLRVTEIAPDELGDFSLRSGQPPTLNAFIGLKTLQEAAKCEGRANLMLAAPGYETRQPTRVDRLEFRIRTLFRSPRDFMNSGSLVSLSPQANDEATVLKLQNLLREQWQLEDAEVYFSEQKSRSTLEAKSKRIFLEPPIVRAAFAANADALPILTYLATLLRTGSNATPYSMITAAGAPWTPARLRDDEIVVSQWLAEDLHVKPGDEIALSYFLPESGAKLEEATNTFRVHSIVPMEMPWADRTLMPDFPGIEKAESTSEWDAGFPLTYEVRKKDDDYWKQYRGTPKAFITLAAGQKMWGNRFGNLTAIRFPIPTNSTTANFQADLEKKILANLKPEELGLRFEPVREQALRAAEKSQDFGGLFLGFSFFLIIAALLLMAMLFQFGLEQRAPEIGTLLALGFTPKQVRNLLLREGVALALLGGVIGTIGGIYFAKTMLHGLATIWRDAVGATSLNFHVTGLTLGIGLIASVVVSAFTLWLALRRFVKLSPRELLAGEIHPGGSKVKRLKAKVVAIAALVAGLALVGWAVATGETQNAGIFFGAGALVLVAGLSFVSAWLVKMEREAPASREKPKPAEQEIRAPLTTSALAVRGCVRRRKRSLATVAMLACGSFLIVSIGVFRLDANRDATQKNSGTGGFALFGETTLPVVHDLNATSGRDFFALNERDLEGVNFVPFRVKQGDEASCLNLNAAQKPRLCGVSPWRLRGRFTFSKSLSLMTKTDPWGALGRTHPSEAVLENGEIPAIGDANSIQWAMHKKVGDTIDYVDERGRPFKVRIVGAVANSILQGQLIIDEAEFLKRFPGESGYRMFLIDAPSNAVAQVSATLSRALQDVGLELTPTAVRLNQFNAVQNTYLGTFQVLGGLGLLLGSVGLGIVVLRNVLERRSELAVLLAVGFRRQQVQRLLLVENGALLLMGLAIGVAAAAIAVLPAVLSPASQLPVLSLGLTLGAVLINGALWTWAATRYAVRGDLLAALRND